MTQFTRRNFLNRLAVAFKIGCFSTLLYAVKTPVGIAMSRSTQQRRQRLLVIYGSAHGSTAEMAIYMGKRLRQGGFSCDVKSIAEPFSMESYDSIVFGAPIHRGQWMEDAQRFLEDNREKIKPRAFACFFTCMAVAKQPPSSDSTAEVDAYQQSVSQSFFDTPIPDIGSFAGKLDYEKCSFFQMLVLKIILGRNGLQAGDYRNWQAVDTWLQKCFEK